MNKISTTFTSLVLALTLTACSGNSDNTSNSDAISSEDTSLSSDNYTEIIETYNNTINYKWR